MAGADRNAVQIQQRADVLRMRGPARTRHAALVARGADEAQTRDLLQAAGAMGQQRGSCAAMLSRPSELDVVDRGAEPDRRLDRRRAGLELVRERR